MLHTVRFHEQVVADQVNSTEHFADRLRGLMFRTSLAEGEGLYIPRCSAIHTCFMRMPIDVVFLDSDGVIVALFPRLSPWKLASCRVGKAVLELGEASCTKWKLQKGDRLVVTSQTL